MSPRIGILGQSTFPSEVEFASGMQTGPDSASGRGGLGEDMNKSRQMAMSNS